MAEIDIEFVLAADAGACLPVDKRQAEFVGQIFINAAIGRSCVDKGWNCPEAAGG